MTVVTQAEAVGIADLLLPLPEAHLVVELRGRIRYANPAAARLVDRPVGSLEGTPLEGLLEDASDLPVLLGRWSRTSALRPGALRLLGGRQMRCDGARLGRQPLLLLRLRDRDQALAPFIKINHRVDTANLRELSRRLETSVAELRTANVRLTAANDEIQQYARAVAHDVRTPLFTIQGFVQLLQQEGHVDEAGAEYLALILGSTKRLQETTDALLEVARLDRVSTVGDAVDTAEILDAVLADLAGELRDADVDVRVWAPMLPVAVDASALRRVLQNLLSNSVRHGSVPGRPLRIDVSSRPVDADVVITVRDDGRGIGDGDRPRLFDLFHRGAGSEHVPGSGVGLAACRKMVTAWGGTITCEPVSGPGSRFTFTAPGVDQHLTPPAEYAADRARVRRPLPVT